MNLYRDTEKSEESRCFLHTICKYSSSNTRFFSGLTPMLQPCCYFPNYFLFPSVLRKSKPLVS